MFEFDSDFITEQGLSEDQLSAMMPKINDHITTLKGDWDKKANTDAENILTGAANKVQEVTKIERKQGEKLADYYSRAWSEFNQEATSSIEQQKKDLEKKIRDASKDDKLKGEYDELKKKYDALQEMEADYEKLKEGDFENKYNTLNSEHINLQQKLAFNSEKPVFPDTVNKYEADAKWKAFEKKVLDKNNLVLVDDNWVAVDKENQHKQTPLSELVKGSEEIQALLEGRRQEGPNSKQGKRVKIEGLPFDLPEKATSADRSKAIKEYLAKEEGLEPTHPSYPKRFQELNMKALGKEPAAAA